MKKLTNKLLAFFLIISISLLSISIFPLTVYANHYDPGATWNDSWANCTYWAWQYAYEYDGVELPNWGNAKNWYGGANGIYPCDKTPSAHSIMCTGSGDLGHVAYVTEYNSSTGQVYIKQGGWRNSSDGRDERWVSAYPSDLQGYIHLGSISFTPEYLGDHFFANIIHQKSGKAVVTTGDSTGSNVQIDTHNGSLIQKWEFVVQNDGSYRIINNHSGKSLDVNDASDANNTNVHTWDINETAAQLWYLKKAENGYQIVPKCALNSALDLENGSSANGTNIQIYSRLDKTNQSFANQVFSLNYLPSFEAQNIGDHFFANIIHQRSGKAIVAVGDSLDSNVEIDALNNSKAQKWEFIRQNDFSYIIINNYSGKCLDVNAASDVNNTNVHIWDVNETAAQLWYLKKVENGYQIVPKCALNSALDLENGTSANGTNIQIYSRLDKTSQSFTNQVFNLKQISSSTHTPGDINGDGSVNNKDLTRLFQYLSDWDVEVNVDALDVNGDGKVNNKDLTRLFQYLSDWDVEIY